MLFFHGYGTEETAAGLEIALEPYYHARHPHEGDDDVGEVLITQAYPIARLSRNALEAPAVRGVALSSANAALTEIKNRPELPPSIIMLNDKSHLQPDLQWTGFPETLRP